MNPSTTTNLPDLFHGTPVAFDVFRDPLVGTPDRGAGYDHQGKAIYLTTDPNGYGRFFARESCAKLALKLSMAGHHDESERIGVSDGVVMSVELLSGTKILNLNDASERIKDLFANSVGDKKIGAELRQAVLDAGYDGLVFQEMNFPEGWEVARAQTVALYRHDKAIITGSRDAEDYRLPRDWTERGESGLAASASHNMEQEQSLGVSPSP